MKSARPRRWSWITGVALGVVALLGVAACAGPAGPEAEGERTLALAMNTAPQSLDPALLAEGQQAFIWSSVYDSLLHPANDGTLEPGAAESWEYSDDARTLTLTLREGMTFSSGAPVDAEAVRATMERTRSTPGQQQGKFAAVESVAAPDARTVVITLSRPDDSLLSNLSLAAGIIGDPATLDTERTALDPVGSGPYVLDRERTIDGSTYVLTKRADHWNAATYPFAEVTLRVIQDRTAVFNALQAGEIDAGGVDPAQAPALEAAGFGLTEVPAVSVGNLVLADRAGEVLPPLADVRVRQAINMAFDRELIVQQILRGNGTATAQNFNPLGSAYVEDLNATYPHDPEGARRLLAEAGYPDGFEVNLPGFVFAQTFQATISQALADIGITAVWDPIPPQNTSSVVASRQYPMFFFLEGLHASPGRELQNNFGPTGFLNPFRSTDPQLEALMTRAAAELDPAAAGALYQQINTYVVENAWSAPVFFVGQTVASAEGVEYLGTGALNLSTISAYTTSDAATG